MFAMLAPPWRSPIRRNTVRSRWKRAQSPHTLVIASRYCTYTHTQNKVSARGKRKRKLAIKREDNSMRRAEGFGVEGGVG